MRFDPVRDHEVLAIRASRSTILYSKNAVVDNLSKHGSRFGTLSWREIN